MSINSQMKKPIRGRPGNSNFIEQIENDELKDTKTKEEWLELNELLLKQNKIASTSSAEITKLDREIHKLNNQRDSLWTKRLQANTKRQQIETIFVNNLIIISGRLTQIEMEVKEAMDTGEWNGKPISLNELPREWIFNEKYLNAVTKLLNRIG